MKSASSKFLLHSLCGLSFALPLAFQSAQAAFTPLGFVSDDIYFSGATAISADGSTVIGMSAYLGPDNEQHLAGFKWTQANGMEQLPHGLPDSPANHLYGVSADGSVIVGLEVLAGGSSFRAYRYTNGSAGFLSPDSFGIAFGVSGNGETVVGQGMYSFSWTEAGGMASIPLPVNAYVTTVHGISADGSTIIGSADMMSDEMQAFRWTASGPEALPITGYTVSPTVVNANGSTIVGNFIAEVGGAEIPFAWTELGVVVLSRLSIDEGVTNMVRAITVDGAWAGGSSDGQAVLWNTQTGEVAVLKDFLVAQGITGLEDWTLDALSGISADGLTLAGSGINPDGNSEGWIVTISHIPEPGTAALLVLGSGLALRRRRLAH